VEYVARNHSFMVFSLFLPGTELSFAQGREISKGKVPTRQQSNDRSGGGQWDQTLFYI